MQSKTMALVAWSSALLLARTGCSAAAESGTPPAVFEHPREARTRQFLARVS